MQHKEVAKRIEQALGKDNVVAAAHCATRLRLVLKDKDKINQKALDDDPDLKGTFYTQGQYQIIVGPGDVNKVYDEFTKLTGVKEASTDDLKEVAAGEKKQNPIMALIKVLSDIFVPLIPALVAGGLLMALNNVLTAEHLFAAKSVVQMYPQFKDVADFVNLLASAPFTFLPILVGYSATKRFGGNGYLGAAMAAAMVMPSLVSGYEVATAMANHTMTYWHIFNLNVAQAGYQGQVLPILAVAWILANIEKFLHKHIPQILDFVLTPLITILTTGFLTFIVVGPVVRLLSDGLTDGIVWLYNTLGAVGGGLFGLFYSPIVISGLHQSFPAIETTLLADVAKTGGDFIFPIACMANVAQGAACLAVFFITKNKKQKSLASSASVSALLGITEPAIFGVNLQLKFPFFCGMIASGIASLFIGAWHVASVALGSAGFLGFISMPGKFIPKLAIAMAISFIISFGLTFIVGRRKLAQPVDSVTQESEAAEINEDPEISVESKQDEVLTAPASGRAIPLSEVNDEVFSTEMMGKGAAIEPTEGKVYAPVDGVMTVTYDSKHAYGIHSNGGADILIHIGLDTVNLGGKHFTANVKQGQMVKKGDLLGTFDLKAIQAAGFDTTTMLIITNSQDYAAVDALRLNQDVTPSDKFITLEATGK